MKVVQVILPMPFEEAFDYILPDSFEGMAREAVGRLIEVPFGQGLKFGLVISADAPTAPEHKLRVAVRLLDVRPYDAGFIEFLKFTAHYTLQPLGAVFAMTVTSAKALSPPREQVLYRLDAARWEAQEGRPSQARCNIATALEGGALGISQLAQKSGASKSTVTAMEKAGLLTRITAQMERAAPPPYTSQDAEPAALSPSQQEALSQLLPITGAQQHKTVMLEGVTGSGKTELYGAAMEHILTGSDERPQMLILLPEIALTTQIVSRISRRLGVRVTLWHSSLTAVQRRDNWQAITRGDAQVVIGARSALFLPFANLRMIIVDEEHDAGYKQEEGVPYHTRDMAVLRGYKQDFPVMLVSASPSIETLANIRTGKYTHVTLGERHGKAVMPDVRIIDMTKQPLDHGQWISPMLREKIALGIARRQQSLLFLNRRGYAPLTLCRTCGYRFACPDCSAWMVLHRRRDDKAKVRDLLDLMQKEEDGKPRAFLQCHHCGHYEQLPPECPECGSEDSFTPCGPGVERLEQEVISYFPTARSLLMTSDNINSIARAKEQVRAIESGEVDIIIGTQMVAKGYHFPALTLVGVIDADMGLEGGDPRAAERTWQLLHQVSGRAGRSELRGEVFLQSYAPQSHLLQTLKDGDKDAFIRAELSRRKAALMPPFSRLCAFIFSGKDERALKQSIYEMLRHSPRDDAVRILGPAPAPISRLRGKYRFRLLLQAHPKFPLQRYIRTWLNAHTPPSPVHLKIDIDPYNFM